MHDVLLSPTQPPRHYGSQFPTLTALPLSYTTWMMPLSHALPNERAAVVFWRAPAYQRVPSPRQGFSIGGSAPTLRALDGDKSPLVLRADVPKNVWPAAPLRAVVCGQAAIPALHGWNRHDSDHNLYTVRACHLIVRRPVKTRASRRWRVLTGRHGQGYDAAHRARHHQKEEPV
jgi:hypothetical protein